MTRSHAAFFYPPVNAIEGAHFPGFGYYKLNNDVIPEGIETQIDFWFRTRQVSGLILFRASNKQDDFIAVEIRNGKVWFIFDCQAGVASINAPNSPKLNDGKWHYVKINRDRRNGKITVDGKYQGNGESPHGATYIDKNTGVYIGGIDPEFREKLPEKILNSVHSMNYTVNFIGCLKELRLQKKLINLDNSLKKVNVEPITSGCPIDQTQGFYVKGGGYFSLKKDFFDGDTIYHLSFEFRTFYTSGILMFVYGEGTGMDSYLTVSLISGDIRVLYNTSRYYGNITVVPPSSVCDGTWHRISLTNFARTQFTITIDGNTTIGDHISDLHVTSELYFGGLPFGSRAALKAGSIGLKVDSTFGGCFKNIKTDKSVNVITHVSSIMNVDLSGCPRNRIINNTSADSCYNTTSELIYVGNDQSIVDGKLSSFTGI